MDAKQKLIDLAWVWSKELSAYQKLTLLALVHESDMGGTCEAPIWRLAEMTGLHPDAVVACWNELHALGLVTAGTPIRIALPG